MVSFIYSSNSFRAWQGIKPIYRLWSKQRNRSVFPEEPGITNHLKWSDLVINSPSHLLSYAFVGLGTLPKKHRREESDHHHPLILSTDNNPLHVFNQSSGSVLQRGETQRDKWLLILWTPANQQPPANPSLPWRGSWWGDEEPWW